MQRIAVPLLLAMAPATGGCVAAAVAAPFMAGGAMATNDAISERKAARAASRAEVDAVAVSEERTEPSAISIKPGSLPAPAAPASSTGQLDRSIENLIGIPAMAEYTSAKLAAAPEGQTLRSAVLANPEQLDGERIACGDASPAVLIDLDPRDSEFGEGSDLPADNSSASDLASLRAAGVEIAWISRNSAANADIVREALSQSGLDPEGEDRLLLMRYPGDRKQTRRAEFAGETCLLAIAGDDRGDFDELYRYLTNPDAALRLETLIGDGWFLTDPTVSRIGPGTHAASRQINIMEERSE